MEQLNVQKHYTQEISSFSTNMRMQQNLKSVSANGAEAIVYLHTNSAKLK
jgi:hypothetical protein